jgi:hypothetical protein
VTAKNVDGEFSFTGVVSSDAKIVPSFQRFGRSRNVLPHALVTHCASATFVWDTALRNQTP